MRYSAIKTCDVHNGEGLRVSLWTQGCKGYCGIKCHNKETWDEKKGKEFTENEYVEIFKQIKRGMNLSIVGGEPLEEYNLKDLSVFLKSIKNDFPELNIWLWTHFLWEEVKNLELIKYLDVIVDGKYIDSLNCDYRKTNIQNDKWRGSSNQRVINVQESLKQNKIIEWRI
ncbi:anaerobic ribonucleoside-triphosphate reductase activating protein [Clostridium botulinum]|uniref:anaerobic ribonucleoside-triphosphate reductase activating protein n=1 Tax=Clostridium botulinum TaxID=1491 RepID=UPI001C9B47B7|nr:anaerobic ribonucleoside-triphosphate reductase activating protein [Clostridium botulinum]MBY6838644.1 anaerobic ribonucleoside-triphosphate reductase activating protein [Clostridium botulinum]